MFRIGIGDTNRLVHGILENLEKVRVGWQRGDRVVIFPMTVIVGISVASTGCPGSGYPGQAKLRADVATPIQAVLVTVTVTVMNNETRDHFGQVIHVEPCG